MEDVGGEINAFTTKENMYLLLLYARILTQHLNYLAILLSIRIFQKRTREKNSSSR